MRGVPKAPIIVAEWCACGRPIDGVAHEDGVCPEEWYAFCPRDESLIEGLESPSIVLCPEGHKVEVYHP